HLQHHAHIVQIASNHDNIAHGQSSFERVEKTFQTQPTSVLAFLVLLYMMTLRETCLSGRRQALSAAFRRVTRMKSEYSSSALVASIVKFLLPFASYAMDSVY
ncbi:MAG: hypothetical protein WEB58_01615, partial [Planctomycetaceae bacterium]